MRVAAFTAFVVAGATAGLLSASGEGLATKLVFAGLGALVGAAVGGALLKVGRAKTPRALTGNPIPGSGVTSEDLAANYWRDKGHPPFMKPPDGDLACVQPGRVLLRHGLRPPDGQHHGRRVVHLLTDDVAGVVDRIQHCVLADQVGRCRGRGRNAVLQVTANNCGVMLYRARMQLRECLDRKWFAGQP